MRTPYEKRPEGYRCYGEGLAMRQTFDAFDNHIHDIHPTSNCKFSALILSKPAVDTAVPQVLTSVYHYCRASFILAR